MKNIINVASAVCSDGASNAGLDYEPFFGVEAPKVEDYEN